MGDSDGGASEAGALGSGLGLGLGLGLGGGSIGTPARIAAMITHWPYHSDGPFVGATELRRQPGW